jgi:hypothetical protein
VCRYAALTVHGIAKVKALVSGCGHSEQRGSSSSDDSVRQRMIPIVTDALDDVGPSAVHN